MIETIFHAHSGLRFLVLLAAVAALVVQALGVFGRRAYGRPSRISMAAFTGLLDLQMLLGIAMLVALIAIDIKMCRGVFWLCRCHA